MIHRSFLVRSFHDPTYAFTRRTCAAAASTILHEFNRVKMTDMVKLWTVSTFTVGAAIVLYLDIIYDQDDPSNRRNDLDLVLETVSGLKLLYYDQIACRGVKVMEALMQHRERRPAAKTLSDYDRQLPDLARFVPRLREQEQEHGDQFITDAQENMTEEHGEGEFRYDFAAMEHGQEPIDILEQWLNLSSTHIEFI